VTQREEASSDSRRIPHVASWRIAVVVPTFRRPEMLQGLLVSLQAGSRVPDEVIVADNDPAGSAAPEAIDGLPVRTIHVGLGVSVAGARNAGWRESTSDLCVFIDDDNKVEKDTIAELLGAFEADGVGLAGPVIYAGDQGTIWCGGIRRSRWTGQTHCLLGGASLPPDVPNWDTEDMPDAFAVPRVVLEEVGGFDEKHFPIHYEEADLGARIRARGLRAVVARNSRIRHYGWVGLSPGGALVRATANHGDERARQMAVSRIRFHMLHSKGFERLSIVGLFIPVWVLITCLTCLTADAPRPVRLHTIRTILAGAIAGYRETLQQTNRA
jgi:GT2 family glycosyltransferase